MRLELDSMPYFDLDDNSAELFCRSSDRRAGWREQASRDSNRDYFDHSNALERLHVYVFPQVRILRDWRQVSYVG
jgi:hypothetical protein